MCDEWTTTTTLLFAHSNLEDFVFVRLERMKLQLQIPQIPKGDGLVGGTGGENKFGIRVEGETVDFGGVGVDNVRRLVGVVGPRVPNHQLLVVGDGAEQRFVEQMPRDVLDDGRVAVVDGQSVEDAILPGLTVYVPQTDRLVIGCREKVSIYIWIP